MKPAQTGKNYDEIAEWWKDHFTVSEYGMEPLKRALTLCTNKSTALEIGCGSSGRMIRQMTAEGFSVTGIDVSKEMIRIARTTDPQACYEHADICTWGTPIRFDLIVAWDSIFHIPQDSHNGVIAKMCTLLNPDGILLYTLGNDIGERWGECCGQPLYHSSIGIEKNLARLAEYRCRCLHLELDQYPEDHVFIIAKKIDRKDFDEQTVVKQS